jgi:branched-chain amino acid transport system substrate-binding protein
MMRARCRGPRSAGPGARRRERRRHAVDTLDEEDAMKRVWAALALAGVGCLASGPAQAEPVKIAIIETLSGGQAAVGKMFLTAINYGLIKLNAEKAWPDGIKVLEYDNQGGPSEAADKVKAAINDGAHIIIQGASSAIGGQITDDVRKHNLRNPGKEIIYFNVGAEAMEFTGSRCHFYHFRWNGNAEIRLRAMLTAMKDAHVLGGRVYVIGQNYSWGHDVQRLVREYSKFGGYSVVGDVIHDVNKIQDFAPYVAKIKETNPDTVITGNWSSDLLLLMKAAGDSGLKVRFATYWMDQPGNVANAGATAIGHYNVSSYYPEANGEATAKFADDFKAKMGQYPVFVQGHTVHGIWGLGEALKKLKPNDGKVNVKQLAFAMEGIRVSTSMGDVVMRKEDHQALLPLVVATVSKDARYKVDGTDMGFKPVRLISGQDAAGPVQPSCKMERPSA